MICHVSPNFTSSILGCKGKSFILIANDPFKFFCKNSSMYNFELGCKLLEEFSCQKAPAC